MVKSLVVASTNPGKAHEITAGLEGLDEWSVEALPAGLPVAEETGTAFTENAIQKAEFYSRLLGNAVWVVADDSGLVVDALGGRPGIKSSRYAPTDDARNLKLLAEMRGVEPDRRAARFICALALARNGRTLWKAEAHVDGAVAVDPAGENGFGYDPLFWVPEFGQTMGQLPPETKNRISHRGQALAMLRTCLETANF